MNGQHNKKEGILFRHLHVFIHLIFNILKTVFPKAGIL